jgi:hypothetical protein
MSAAACAMTFLSCAIMFNRRVALIASLLLTFSFNQYVLATSLNNETPYVLLLTVLVLLTWRAMHQPHRWNIAVLGVVHGLCMSLRPEHPLLMAMMFVWMVVAPRSNSRAAASLTRTNPLLVRLWPPVAVGVVSLLVCVPWIVHANLATHRFNDVQAADINFNLAPIEWTESARRASTDLPAFARVDLFNVFNHVTQAQGRQSITGQEIHEYLISKFDWIPKPLPGVVLISSQGPFSFALANHPSSDGGFSRAAIAHPLRGDNPTFSFAFPPHNRVFTDGWRVGWESITADRDATLRNVRRKFERFADGITSGFGAANLPLNRFGAREPVDIFVSDIAIARWCQLLVLALIAAGVLLALARRMPASLWLVIILNKLIITLLFYGYARQGASIAPAFFVFIAIAVDTLLLPLDRRLPGVMRYLPAATLIGCIAMLATDVALKRSPQLERIVGVHVDRPEFGANAIQAFNRIEIR